MKKLAPVRHPIQRADSMYHQIFAHHCMVPYHQHVTGDVVIIMSATFTL